MVWRTTPSVINVIATLHKSYINNGINNSDPNCSNSQHILNSCFKLTVVEFEGLLKVFE